jgi:flagellar hook-basal body complex protein FliE
MGEGSPKTEMINPALLDGVSANFIVKGPNGVEKAYPMRTLVVTIGRSDQCDIAVKDGSMSGKHAEVSKFNGEIKCKDLGSANGIYVNGEKVEEAELYDGDILRLGQTSIRVDIVGGKIRPGTGMSPKVAVGIIVGALALAAAAVAIVLVIKKKTQHKHDVEVAQKYVEAAREGQKTAPCTDAQVALGEASRWLNTIPATKCSEMPGGEAARERAAKYRDIAKTYERMVTQLNGSLSKAQSNTQALAANVDSIGTTDIKAKMAEAQEAVEERLKVTQSFIADWRKLATETTNYAKTIELVVGGQRTLCPTLDAGIKAKSAGETMVACQKNFAKAKNGVEEKLKELEESVGSAAAKD